MGVCIVIVCVTTVRCYLMHSCDFSASCDGIYRGKVQNNFAHIISRAASCSFNFLRHPSDEYTLLYNVRAANFTYNLTLCWKKLTDRFIYNLTFWALIPCLATIFTPGKSRSVSRKGNVHPVDRYIRVMYRTVHEYAAGVAYFAKNTKLLRAAQPKLPKALSIYNYVNNISHY